ncbi:sensor histidine kinase [Catenulispora rubra]|uniref:sensor histidine kinase n=1 Tax=Catenulispora rubra TaxID=280293 RepID=UPI00189259A5|nr:histidine kinase [Catenulispora rubra]
MADLNPIRSKPVRRMWPRARAALGGASRRVTALAGALRSSMLACVIADLAVAAFLVAVAVFVTGPVLRFWNVPTDPMSKPAGLFGSISGWRGAVTLWWAASFLQVVGFALRRRILLAGTLLVVLGAAVHLGDARLYITPVDLLAPFCLYTAASRVRSRRASITILIVTTVGCWAVSIGGSLLLGGHIDEGVVYHSMDPSLAVAAAWFAGDASRGRRIHVALLEERAADLERERDQHAALAAAAERAHLTREMHDVVAHGIAVMVIQAQAAKAVMDDDRPQAARALDETVAVGRTSLAEMRRLLDIARRDRSGRPASRSPQPGAEALPALIDQLRRAGVDVSFQVVGRPVPLELAVDLTVYRIVQEALTNTVRHAGPGASAAVSLHYDGETDTLVVESRDVRVEPPALVPAPAPSPPSSRSTAGGNGLPGIAERVRAVGGRLDTGPTQQGFLVRAVLPRDGAA